MADRDVRIERDTLGEMEIPAKAYYGVSTQRAVLNFPVSGTPLPRRFIRALGSIKRAAALANRDLRLLEPRIAAAIERAAGEVAEGKLDAHFPVDVFQTGSGTSSNMNANEVIANRAAELLGAPRGSRGLVHPNDHVNLGQSSNDVVPTALHVATILAVREVLDPGIESLRAALQAKAAETWDVIKTGRTHLQDATPIRLGQELRGYAGQMERARRRLAIASDELCEVPLGGTAVGTGVNTHPEFAGRVCTGLAEALGVPLRETGNHFQAQATLDTALQASAAIRTTAVGLNKIANDIRWMASGPRTGLGEIALPEVQPGSSIMPGKVNPVIAESLIMACADAVASDTAVLLAAQGGNFELNTMLPVAAYHLVRSAEILGAAAKNFAERCVAGLTATGRGPALVEHGLAIVTGLVPLIGYDAAAAIAKEAAASGKTIREVAATRTPLTAEQLDTALDPKRMTGSDR